MRHVTPARMLWRVVIRLFMAVMEGHCKDQSLESTVNSVGIDAVMTDIRAPVFHGEQRVCTFYTSSKMLSTSAVDFSDVGFGG